MPLHHAPPRTPLTLRWAHWASLRLTVTVLSAVMLALVGLALLWALQRPLPDSAPIARYVGNGIVDFKDPRTLSNPWRAIPGCVYMADGSYWRIDDQTNSQGRITKTTVGCDSSPAVADQAIPPDLIERLTGTLVQRRRSGAPNNPPAQGQGQTAPQGHAVHLTLSPSVQQAAQAHAECFAGDAQKCAELRIDMTPWVQHYEGAAVRSVGMLVMDTATGAIEALASAMSHCYRQDHTSTAPRRANCPDLPQAPANRPYKVSNRAISDAMPGSTYKLITALTLLRDPELAARLMGPEREKFKNAIKTSDSPWFLDHLFCTDTDIHTCRHPYAAQQVAADLGFNTHCAQAHQAQGDYRCGALNLLGDNAIGNYALMAGRAFVTFDKADKRFVLMTPNTLLNYPKAFVRPCSQQKWKECGKGASVVMSEAYGEGNALASPLGLATALSNVANAANAYGTANAAIAQITPHLVIPTTKPTASRPNPIAPQHAQLLLEGMTLTHQQGSARSACLRATRNNPTACQNNRIASKTGTPKFAHHSMTLAKRKAFCAQVKPGSTDDANCQMSAFKWYIALVKSQNRPDAPWDKAIVVLSERNFNQATGIVDSPTDGKHENQPNVSAELGLRFIYNHYLKAQQP